MENENEKFYVFDIAGDILIRTTTDSLSDAKPDTDFPTVTYICKDIFAVIQTVHFLLEKHHTELMTQGDFVFDVDRACWEELSIFFPRK